MNIIERILVEKQKHNVQIKNLNLWYSLRYLYEPWRGCRM